MRYTVSGLTALTALAVLPSLVQGTQLVTGAQDTRWLAWAGCWEGSGLGADQGEPAEFTVCLQPGADENGVEMLTYSEGGHLSLEALVADGEPRPLAEGGCEGEREAVFSADG